MNNLHIVPPFPNGKSAKQQPVRYLSREKGVTVKSWRVFAASGSPVPLKQSLDNIDYLDLLNWLLRSFTNNTVLGSKV